MSDCDCPEDELFEKPFYTHPCSEVKEDHARHLIVHQYVGCVKCGNIWIVPTNDAATWVKIPALVDALVGSVLWNPDYGKFRITAYDVNEQKVLVQRVDVEGTAQPGETIPLCTKFIITADDE